MTSIICLTPIRNEEWILDRFLKCASLWADHIIIADQNSSDNSKEIAKSYSKVTLISNPSATFNEPERQKLLIEEARKIIGPKILIALDADEFLTSNFLSSNEWKSLKNAKPGTILRFHWVNLLPDMKNCWIPQNARTFGFVDDGSAHVGQSIHSCRVPTPENSPSLGFNEIKVLHYQYVDWQRMKRKHRWYQCLEKLHDPSKSATQIYRQYHHMDVISRDDAVPINPLWFKQYLNEGIDMTTITMTSTCWWDEEVLKWFEEYNTNSFRKLNIWQIDWLVESEQLKQKYKNYDPRNIFEKLIHYWLRLTQPFFTVYESNNRKKVIKKFIQCIDFFLIGW